MAGIVYADYYIPETSLPVWEFLKCSNFKHARDEDFCECFISQSRQEHVRIEEQRDETGMFELLLDRLFRQCHVSRGEISHIIYTSPDNWERDGIYIPYYLQANYELNSASITGMVQECVTTLQALQFAGALVDSGMARNVLILAVCFGRSMEERYTGTTVVGDGAGIMLVGRNGNLGRLDGAGSLSDGRYSCCKYRKLPPKVNGVEIAKKGASFITGILQEKGLTLDSLNAIVPQNISYSEYHMYTRYLGIPVERIFTKNISDGGHLAEVDTIRNFVDFHREGNFAKGDRVLLFGSGTIGSGMDAVYNGVLLEL